MPTSWLETPSGAAWPDPPSASEANPYIRYRRLLWSWHRAMDIGWTDEDFTSVVTSLDAAVASVDGSGFVVTPSRWDPALGGTGATAQVFAKDETGNVGGSHKARHLMGLLLHLAVDAVAGDARLAISSCGNAALGAATVARAAGRPIDVFIPTWADPTVVAVLNRLDATVHVCERRHGELGDPCMLRFQEAVDDGALAFGVQATDNVWTLDGGRTIGWELADALGAQGIDNVLVQVGGGALLTSCAMGLIEGTTLGPLPETPAVWAIQAEGCAPFDRAWRQLPDGSDIDQRLALAEANQSLMTPWDNPESAATGILDDVTYDWLGIARALLSTNGGSIVASELEILAANERVATSGYNADHTGTSGYAGLLAAVRTGSIASNSSAAVLITGVRR
jgi:threonine synthase